MGANAFVDVHMAGHGAGFSCRVYVEGKACAILMGDSQVESSRTSCSLQGR